MANKGSIPRPLTSGLGIKKRKENYIVIVIPRKESKARSAIYI
jgi:hypothetical protein